MLVPMNESCLLLLMLNFQGMQLRHLGHLLQQRTAGAISRESRLMVVERERMNLSLRTEAAMFSCHIPKSGRCSIDC